MSIEDGLREASRLLGQSTYRIQWMLSARRLRRESLEEAARRAQQAADVIQGILRRTEERNNAQQGE